MNIKRLVLLYLLLPGVLTGQRIVTLAPALTEIVFELGKGDLIIGNTKFCDYPEAAKKIKRVGGLMDLSLEILIDMKPDLVILYPEHAGHIKILEGKTKLLIVKHENLADLFAAIEKISQELNVPQKGASIIARIQNDFAKIRQKAANKTKKKVLMVAGRNPDSLSNLYIIGRKDFLNELLDIAGGVNAYSGKISYPNISIESIVAMNPDIIIELSAYNQNIKDSAILNVWRQYPIINAAKNKRIDIIRDPVWLRPGPRVATVAGEMVRLLHRE